MALLGCLLFFGQPQLARAESDSEFCRLASPLLVGLKNTDSVEVSDSISNVIVIENISDFHVGGVTVGIGVFKNQILSHVLVVAEHVTLEPKTTQAITFDAAASMLPVGEYQYRAVATQGSSADFLADLLIDENDRRITFNKIGDSKPLLDAQISINEEAIEIVDDSRPLSITVATKNVSSAPIFEAEIDLVFARGSVPYGTAMLSKTIDQAKLFPGSSRQTSLTTYFYNRGPHTLFVVQQLPAMLSPVTILPIQIGDRTNTVYETRLSAIGAKRDGDNMRLVGCIEELRNAEVYKSEVATVSAQATQSPDFIGEVVSSEGNQFVTLMAPLLASQETVTSLSLFRTESETTNSEDISQSISLTFDCDRHRSLCNIDTAEAVADFVQEETTQISFWFYAGIALAGLLVMLLIVKRLKPETGHHDKHHSEHELH